MMKEIVLIITLVFACASAQAQANLVRNPSFEQYTQCPSTADQITYADYWSGIDSVGVNSCIPEYCNACVSVGNFDVPSTGRYFQYARTGSAFAHVQVFYDEQIMPSSYLRDYLQGRLYDTLIYNQSYCVTFHINLAEMSRYGIDKLGAYLDDGSIDATNNCGLPQTQYTPQVEYTDTIITDTMHWITIEGTFIANGTERFITLGNFYSLANTDTIRLPDNVYNNFTNDNYSWFLIDDVSVIESDLPAYAGGDTWVAEGDSVFIGRTPEVGLECYWYVNSNVVDSGAGIWAKPDTTTTYVVSQTLCGVVRTDTVTVSVFPVSVNGITNSRQLSVYPNPAGNVVNVMQERVVFTEAVIVNNVGQQVGVFPLIDKNSSADISALPAGVYYLQLRGDRGREVRSFVKM